MLNKSEFETKRAEIIERLNKEGIRVGRGTRKPVNGRYSRIIGNQGEVLRIDIPRG